MEITKQDIVNGSKLLAEYLEWKYIPFSTDLSPYKNGGWYKYKTASNLEALGLKKSGWIKVEQELIAKFICRTHSELRFFNDWNALALVIEKLEKEDLHFSFDDDNFEGVEVSRFTTRWAVCINLRYDPCIWISKKYVYKDLPEKQQLFFALVDAVNYINNLRNA